MTSELAVKPIRLLGVSVAEARGLLHSCCKLRFGEEEEEIAHEVEKVFLQLNVA